MSYFLTAIQSGKSVKTKSGLTVTFVALLAKNIPAPLLVEIGGGMESYFVDGRFNSPYESHMDLVISDFSL